MKKTMLLLLVFVFSAAIYAEYKEADIYCPMKVKQRWVYSWFSKKLNKPKDDVKIYINRIEKRDNTEYFVCETSAMNARYYVRKDASGVYIKSASVTLPFLGFINIDMDLYPEVCILKFPIKKGESWKYHGAARIHAVLFVSVEKKFSAEFIQMGRETVDVKGRTFSAYHLYSQASRGWEAEKALYGECWLGENAGLIKGETKNSLMEIKSYDEGNTEK